MNSRARLSKLPALDARGEECAHRLSEYVLALELSAMKLRHTYTQAESKAAYDLAREEWEKTICTNFTPPPLGSPELEEVWKKINPILTSNPTTAKDLNFKVLTGGFAMGLVTLELDNDPMLIPVINAAHERTMRLLPPEGNEPLDDAQSLFSAGETKQIQLADFVGREVRCTNGSGDHLDFAITDYGTSFVTGPWVKYLPKGSEEVLEMAADVMEEMLENAEILGD